MLAIREELQLPVKFIGVGEKYRIFNHLMPMHSLQHYLKKNDDEPEADEGEDEEDFDDFYKD